MYQSQNKYLLQNPLFRVVSTWLGSIILPILSALIVVLLLNSNLASARQLFAERSYLTIYFEIAGVGLIPVLFTLLGKDDPARYGLNRKGLLQSLAFSVLFVVLYSIYSFFTTGQLINYEIRAFGLIFPANIWYGVMGIFAYGPLEVFFFIWLVYNTEQLLNTRKKARFLSLALTSFVFGLMHIISTQSISNAITVSIIFFILGSIYSYTKNSIGPMLAWTLINGQVFYLAQMLWQ